MHKQSQHQNKPCCHTCHERWSQNFLLILNYIDKSSPKQVLKQLSHTHMHTNTPSSLSRCIKAVHSLTIDFHCSSEPISACNWHDKQGNPISSEQIAEKTPLHHTTQQNTFMIRMNRTPSTGREWSKIYACFIRLERRERERESKEWIVSRRRGMANDKRACDGKPRAGSRSWESKVKKKQRPSFFWLSACFLTLCIHLYAPLILYASK